MSPKAPRQWNLKLDFVRRRWNGKQTQLTGLWCRKGQCLPQYHCPQANNAVKESARLCRTFNLVQRNQSLRQIFQMHQDRIGKDGLSGNLQDTHIWVHNCILLSVFSVKIEMEIATSYNTFKLARWIERTIPLLDICHNHHNSWLCKKLAKCRIFKSEREKLFFTQCKNCSHRAKFNT